MVRLLFARECRRPGLAWIATGFPIPVWFPMAPARDEAVNNLAEGGPEPSGSRRWGKSCRQNVARFNACRRGFRSFANLKRHMGEHQAVAGCAASSLREGEYLPVLRYCAPDPAWSAA